MGAFKNKSKTIFLKLYDKTFFFSTDHCQETDELFIPITLYTLSTHEIAEAYKDYGYKEIDNPNPDFKP